MAGLVPAIHALLTYAAKKDVDARPKAGHDESAFHARSRNSLRITLPVVVIGI
jgi:hypothetical protein